MQNRDDVDGSQRPATADAPNLKTPATSGDLGGHMGPGGDPVEGDTAAIEDDLAKAQAGQSTPAKE